MGLDELDSYPAKFNLAKTQLHKHSKDQHLHDGDHSIQLVEDGTVLLHPQHHL